jgi:hypothetical protein
MGIRIIGRSMDNEKTPGPEPIDPKAIDDSDAPQTENQAQPGLALPDDVVNLLPFLLKSAKTNPELLKFVTEELPKKVINEFTEDWDSRSKFREKNKERVKLFLGDLNEKSEPFKHCANMHHPILLERILRLTFRTYAELFPPGRPFCKVIPSSNVSDERARVLTLASNWQFSKEISDFPKHAQRALIDFFLDGYCVFFSYRDLDTDTNRHDHLSVDEVVWPYTWKTSRVDMSDVPRITRILRMYKRDLRKMQARGFYAQVDEAIKQAGSNDLDIDHVIKDLVDKFEGVDRTENLTGAPYTLLEYHGWVEIPGMDEEVPMRVVVEYKSKTVLGIYRREYDDPDDRVRFDQQNAEFTQWHKDAGQYMQAMALEQQLHQHLAHPGVNPTEATMVAHQLDAERPNPPPQPSWMEQDDKGEAQPPKKCKQLVINPFSIGVCIENPNGGPLGIGTLLLPFQAAANIITNQFIDQGTLANSMSGFLHESVKLPPGMTSVSPNEVIRVRGISAEALQTSFLRITAPPPNPQLLNGVKMQLDAADGVSSAEGVLSGEKEGAETFRGQATRVEQATMQISVPAGNFVLVLSQIVRNNFLLDSQYMPDEKTMDVIDPMTNKMTPIKVGRDMYKNNYAVSFTSDLSFSSRASKTAEADDVLGMLTKGVPPQLATMSLQAPIYAEAIKRCLMARGMNELVQYVKSDEEIMAAIQQQQAQVPPPGASGAQQGANPQMPPPAVPTGQPNSAPGSTPPQFHRGQGVPTQAAQPAQQRQQ